MNKILQQLHNKKLLVLVAALLLGTQLFSQVTANLIINPPYSPFFRDYAGFSNNKVLITLISTRQQDVYLTASIKKDDNSITIATKPTYRPNVPIKLLANIPATLSGAQLKNLYGSGSTNDLQIVGLTEQEIALNQALPEGNYTICVDVKDYANGAILATQCRNIYVAYYEPPQIIQPMNGSSILATTPPLININWSPTAPGVAGVNYRLKIVKLINGVTPIDALNNNIQVQLDRANINSTFFPLDIASGVKLETGKLYAMQVTASSPNAFFKNGGRSEYITFSYKENPFAIPSNVQLSFITPSPYAKNKFIEVNNKNNFVLGWNWIDITKLNQNINQSISDTTYKKYGVSKYDLVITCLGNDKGKKNTNFIYKETFEQQKGTLQHNLIKTLDETKAAGFQKDYTYRAVITAKDFGGNVVGKPTQIEFVYIVSANEEPMYTTQVQGNLKYGFEGKSAQYNVATSPITIELLKPAFGVGIPGKPVIEINGKKYKKITQTSTVTLVDGTFNTSLKVEQNKILDDSVCYRIIMDGKYYISTHFKTIKAKLTGDTAINFGQLVAKTYGYALTVNVTKAFASYKVSINDKGKLTTTVDTAKNKADFIYNSDGSMTYSSDVKKVEAGISVALFRKTKADYVPRVEGDLSADNNKTGNVQVAKGVTTIEKVGGKDVAVVKFNNLLANLFVGDEYYIQALNPSIEPIQVNGKWVYPAFNDDEFIASELPIKIPAPVNISKPDSLYRNIAVDYKIISKKAPTSVVKGRLLYKWGKANETDQLRPVANQKFTVVIDYLANGESIGMVKGVDKNAKEVKFSEKFFVPDGKDKYDLGMELLDQGTVMGTGKTDEQGNYKIELVNFNKKGSLGKGKVVEKGWTVSTGYGAQTGGDKTPGGIIKNIKDQISNPGDGQGYGGENIGGYGGYDPGQNGYGGNTGYTLTGNSNNNMQGYLNNALNHGGSGNGGNNGFGSGGNFGFNSNTGFFEAGLGLGATGNIGGGAMGGMQLNHGPSAPNNASIQDELEDEEPTVNFERVYRIVPDSKYLQPTFETITVQPFEAKATGDATSRVNGKSIKVTTLDGKIPKGGILVTIFRRLEDKKGWLPEGEGDGKYTQKELINPQYKDNNYASNTPKNIANGSLYTTKFEQLWSGLVTTGSGEVLLKNLLHGYNDYYIQACSNPEANGDYYKASYVSPGSNYELNINLEPLPSRALLRTIDNTTQKAVAGSRIYITGYSSQAAFTDNDGYAELKANESPLNQFVNKPNASVTFKAKGSGYNFSAPLIFTFPKPVGSQFSTKIFLDPSSYVTGTVRSIDENNKPIKAFVQSNAGKTVETDDNGYFSIPFTGLGGDYLKIIPKDVAYFDSTIVFKTTIGDGEKKLNNISLYRRKHRIMFIVKDENGNGIKNATITLGKDKLTTLALGLINYEFENVSVNNYTFIIRGPEGSNYIPITQNIKNEESKDYVFQEIILEKGSEVNGIVKLDGVPVKNAKVYVDVSSQKPAANNQQASGTLTSDANLNIDYTDANGKYSLKGVQVNNQKIHILATLDTSFTVNGDNQVADIKNNIATTNLNLTKYTGMLITNVYGFPLTVEKITTTAKADEVKVTGTIKWSNSISNFKWIEGTDVLRVEDVTFKAKIVNGVKVGEADETIVDIEGLSSVKLRYLDKYNVKLRNLPVYFNGIPVSTPLGITKDGDYGVIAGKVNIVDNSFNYPSTYINFTKKDQFYLAENNNDNISTSINAVKSAFKTSEATINSGGGMIQYLSSYNNQVNGFVPNKTLYNISNANGGDIDFKFIEFNAKADAKNSSISKDGKIHLNINMACKVPNAQPENFTVNVKDVVLDDNKVYAASSNSPLELKLEDWTLQIKNWKLSPEEGGITSSNGLIKTSTVDIPFTKFNLRSDMFVMDDYNFNELKIGGGIKELKEVNSSNAAMVFDNKTGSDMKPHWRFSMSSTGDPVAKIKDLPSLPGSIGINYIQLLSNNQNIIQLQQSSVPMLIYGNGMAKFKPQAINNGPDFFDIIGSLNVAAPRTSDMALTLKYSKQSGSLAMKPTNVICSFEGKGFVNFTALENKDGGSNITITNNNIAITGEVEEKPSKSFNAIPAVFNISNNSYSVDLPKDYVLQLSANGNAPTSKGYKLTLTQGSMKVVGSDWDILTYSGNMESNSNNANEKGIQPTPLTFKVLGDVAVDGNGAKMDGINTPFGAMTMVFDFNNKRLTGTLAMKDVQMGTNTINATVETVFDPEGFYVAGGGEAKVLGVHPIVDGTYNLGFMIGSYPLKSPSEKLWQTVTAYKMPQMKNDCFVGTVGGRLKGFYISVDRVVLDEQASFDFVLISGYVEAKAAIGVDLWANFAGNATMGVAINAFAHGAAGMSACTGTSMSGSVDAKLIAKFGYTQGQGIVLDAKVDVSFQAHISQSLIFTTVTADKSVSASASAGTSGFSLSLSSGVKQETCYQ
jgi:hypothetical protein